ncbi:hypothetical protein C8J55DRAFT_594498 [Lentinula edodes]|uniref:Transposase domain-containing protein n=1 Tax=Lentinula lateritia TaxID=40482 RepID=A0A9W9AQW1_9AGAR|nr:hypothetical protein C8J55DRAFT_594498 [Lentinula edodes]
MCCLLAAWLNLHAGVSRNTVNAVLKALNLIVVTMLNLTYAALQAADYKIGKQTPKIGIPLDIRTVYARLNLDPKIHRLFCCPTCFKMYPLDTSLKKCNYQKSSRAKPCNTDLWSFRHSKKGHKIQIPRCSYTTTSFDSWLQSFLNRPSIEKCLYKTFIKTQNPAPQERMYDIQDSPFWDSIRHNLNSPHDLIFSVYVDWFNPLGNKQAGKQISCGAIVLYCLNLPLEIRFRPENIFVVGMMPGPHGPTVGTIHHILHHYCNSIMEFDLPGKSMPTSSYPEGARVSARVYPNIADLLGSKKFTGFGSPSATYFCTWCTLSKEQVESLDYDSWQLRDGNTVKAQAQAWKNAVTISEKENLFKQNSIRWIPQHDIPYFDPVQHVVLGMMHNTLEGHLEFHLRELWGLGRTEKKEKQLAQEETERDRDEEFSVADTEETLSELEDLEEESREWQQSVTGSANDLNDLTMDDVDDDNSTSTATPDDDSDDPDFKDLDVETLFKLTPQQIAHIRHCISEILLPTWVERPPRNLGEKSHGKLKAHQLLILFTVIFPLIIPELWAFGNETERKLLENFCDLVAATNIIASYSVTPTEADDYGKYFKSYRNSMRELFPQYHSLPNHHYAMHNPEQLKFWGPLACLSEFPGERLNGEFARISTNNHFNEIELTMVRQFGRKANLNVILNETDYEDDATRDLLEILAPVDVYEFARDPAIMSSYEVAQFYKKHDDFKREEYNTLLHYLNSTGKEYYTAYPESMLYQSPTLLSILQPVVQRIRDFNFQGKTYSNVASHEAGSHIQYYIPGGNGENMTGCIMEIWQLPLEQKLSTFLLVKEHLPLSPSQKVKSPYAWAPCSILQSELVQRNLASYTYLIEPHHIICHLAVYKRPAGTYDIPQETMAIVWSLNRGRRK